MEYNIDSDITAKANPEDLKNPFSIYLLRIVERLCIKVSKLEQENAELKARLTQNSANSSRPPSSDGYRKISKVFSNEGKKRQGGQIGHKGGTLRQVENPDKIEWCYPTKCHCGHEFTNISEIISHSKQQLFEIPAPKIYVTEYKLCKCKCPKCGAMNKGKAPDNINSPVQYGNMAKSFVVLLNNEIKIPVAKIKQLFKTLFGCEMNESTTLTATKSCYNKLEKTEEIIKEKIIQSDVVYVDETGIRIQALLNWLHNASTELYTYLFVHSKRGKEALESDQSIISELRNRLMHDCLSAYFRFTQVKHSLCNAHILRELQGIIDNDEKGTAYWARQMQEHLLKLHNMDFSQRIENKLLQMGEYHKICRQGLLANPPAQKVKGKRGRPKNTKGRNLAHRLIEYSDEILAFAYNENVPFTNNQAERDLRPAKIKLKVSNCFRSDEGAKHYARIQGFISTAKKQGKNVLTEIYNTFNGHNFILDSS
jgi:transposase